MAVETVERFLVVERYRESAQMASTRPRRNHEPGTAGGSATVKRSRAHGTSATVR
jgi:hypothetical protein